MQRNKSSVFYNWGWTKALLHVSFKKHIATPLPTQYNVENQMKLQVLVFNIV